MRELLLSGGCKLEIGLPINIDGKSCLNKIQQYLATPLSNDQHYISQIK